MEEEATAGNLFKAHFSVNSTVHFNEHHYTQAFLDMFTGANADLWCAALRRDLSKPRQEAMTMEVEYNANVCRTALRHLDEWAADETTEKSTLTLLDGTFIRREPYGVCLVLGAWNYPVQLTFAPVVGALAAGNAVFIKPSELAPSVAELARKLVAAHMDRDLVKVVEGGVEETTRLLQLRFDYIFFTGSTRVGRIVGEAAARHLTPCTLELGGKSPLYLDASVDWERAVKRIVWGKMVNLGQTCVAPDYVLCSKYGSFSLRTYQRVLTLGITFPVLRANQEKLLSHIREIYPKFYGSDASSSKDLCRIVNERNFDRLSRLLADTRGKVSFGGASNASERFLDLTVVTNVGEDDSLMTEELFGPILPIVNAETLDDAIK